MMIPSTLDGMYPTFSLAKTVTRLATSTVSYYYYEGSYETGPAYCGTVNINLQVFDDSAMTIIAPSGIASPATSMTTDVDAGFTLTATDQGGSPTTNTKYATLRLSLTDDLTKFIDVNFGIYYGASCTPDIVSPDVVTLEAAIAPGTTSQNVRLRPLNTGDLTMTPPGCEAHWKGTSTSNHKLQSKETPQTNEQVGVLAPESMIPDDIYFGAPSTDLVLEFNVPVDTNFADRKIQ